MKNIIFVSSDDIHTSGGEISKHGLQYIFLKKVEWGDTQVNKEME